MQFDEDIKFAKEFLSDTENMIGRIASPVPVEDIAVIRHYLSMSLPPYLEIGVLWGGSLILAGKCMSGHLYGIDPFWGYMSPGAKDPYVKGKRGAGQAPTIEDVEENIEMFGLSDRTTLFKATHPPLPEEIEDTTFGAIFIDGDHKTESVLNDWNGIKYNVSGYVLFHDLHHPTVQRAWQTIVGDPLVSRVEYAGGRGKFSRIGVLKVD